MNSRLSLPKISVDFENHLTKCHSHTIYFPKINPVPVSDLEWDVSPEHIPFLRNIPPQTTPERQSYVSSSPPPSKIPYVSFTTPPPCQPKVCVSTPSIHSHCITSWFNQLTIYQVSPLNKLANNWIKKNRCYVFYTVTIYASRKKLLLPSHFKRHPFLCSVQKRISSYYN